MPVHPNVKTCTHIKVTGIRCGSPALRGEQFCYFHQRMVRGVRTPPQSRLHPVALIEDGESLQASLMEIINALARNTIDLHRAELILRALHIAVKNVRRVHFDYDSGSMIKEVPDYPTPATPAKPAPAAVVEPVDACKELSGVIPSGAVLQAERGISPAQSAVAREIPRRPLVQARAFGMTHPRSWGFLTDHYSSEIILD